MHSWRRLNEDWEIRFYDDEVGVMFCSYTCFQYDSALQCYGMHVPFFQMVQILLPLVRESESTEVPRTCPEPCLQRLLAAC